MYPQVVNYGAKGAEQFVAGDVGGESSDSSDDFDATNAPEDSEDEMDPSTEGEPEDWRCSTTITNSKANNMI